MSNYRNKQQQRQAQPEGALHTIKLDSPSDKTLANILYRQDRGHLHQYFGSKFGVQFDVSFNPDKVAFYGSEENATRVKRAFDMLSGQVEARAHIDKDAINKIAAQLNPAPSSASPAAAFKAANQNRPSTPKHEGGSSGAEFQALNPAQENLANLIADNDLIFALGPAGTGKTHVAVVKGIEALKSGAVKKLLLARPAAEAGEKIGYLPGDANAKLAPYMRPIYDELDKAFGPGKYKGMMENGVIEIVPIGYMRGRTFDEAFIIVDEAQNLTREQTKMAITRIGKGSKMVMTGDPQQIDLRDKNDSGLIWASQIMEGKTGAATQTFEQTHVVRSEIVQTFVAAVDEFDNLDKPKLEAVTPAKAQGNQPPKPGQW
ncbi:MAG TPA: PhoH family protein [Patescibacteria group bacterium]|nr:PhoH family protein [Patescibacteria group bacterium]